MNAEAQILKGLDKRIEKKVQDRVNRKVDKAIDKELDKVEGAGKDVAKKDDNENRETREETTNKEEESASETFSVSTKFDFIAGDKVVAIDNFSRANVGDFPSDWFTNGSGEVVTVEGHDEKWLEMRGNFTYYPEFIKNLPENFTLEYDLIYNYDTKSAVKNIFGIYILSADAKTKNEPVFQYGFNKPGKAGAAIEFESYSPNRLNIFTWSNKKVDQNTRTFSESGFIKQMRNQKMHVSVWRQKERVRMYLNEKKIVDVPRLLTAGETYNMIKFALDDREDKGRAYIANVRFAESTPDMRTKLLIDGKFVTAGIYFSTNSDKIKPESYGILKEIAEALKSSADIRIKIVGHTDSDGSDEPNLVLSQKRAKAVKEALITTYGIDASRIETDGKGEKEPLVANTTEAGKANNRRVEFIKI
jgi:flagellar motor protein MotB